MRNWIEFYKNKKAPTDPSDFALFCIDYINTHTVLDVGCGNGRDAEFLVAKGIDQHSEYGNFTRFQDYEIKEDVVYSRFFLHAISDEEIKELIRKTPNMFMAECRAEGDEPIVYTDHERNFVNPEWLLKTLIEEGFKILYFKVGRGLAVYKKEDPLCLRVICKR